MKIADLVDVLKRINDEQGNLPVGTENTEISEVVVEKRYCITEGDEGLSEWQESNVVKLVTYV